MTSKLGIFWIYRHEVIFSHSVPLADGLPYGEAITGTKDYADYWEELRSVGELSVLPHHLQDEYFSIPRGRVVYHTYTQKFYVYHGNNVTKSDLQKVAKLFWKARALSRTCTTVILMMSSGKRCENTRNDYRGKLE
ncbi:hypothetical protein [uncultured Treponema sp.]|uniref:hypothetical protein n=1 Tax=uncultured Treponema sp. TaxID=162155 RepID=UPI0025D8EF0A|nr:hypothetical protein [uncultured Treponema sp.]